MWMEDPMSEDFRLTSINHQVGNALNPNPPEGYDATMDAMQHQLMREQHDFYEAQQRYANHQPQGDSQPDFLDQIFGLCMFLFVVGFLVYAAVGAVFGD
jgi:hypothetical protein